MSDPINMLAKSIEIDTLQKTVVSLSRNLAEVTLDNQAVRAAYTALNEDSTKRLDELSKANVALVLEKNDVKAAQERQQNIIHDTSDKIIGLRHQLERHEIIWGFLFRRMVHGHAIELPRHASLGKTTKKSELLPDIDSQTSEGLLTYIDNLYQKLDNPELRRLLRE